MDFSYLENESLRKYLVRRYDEPTVILSFLILLRNVIDNGLNSTMSKTQVERIFNSRNRNFGINTFRRDYIKRQSGDPANAINENDNKEFFIRQEFLANVSLEQMELIETQINAYYLGKISTNLDFVSSLEELLTNAIDDEIFYFIMSILNEEQPSERRGQSFEIVSFAILQQFYKMRGFNLKRFSTTFANDGGMDFIGEETIYQATVIMNSKKFEEDIIKSPDIPRIIVYKRLSSNFDISLFDHPLILDVISLEKLNEHLIYIRNAVNKSFLRGVVEIMIKEFKREFYH